MNDDCAVQLLLIVDYICDWARDVYRPEVMQCLDGIHDRRYGRESRVPRPSPSDSNIWSLRHSSVGTPALRTPRSDFSRQRAFLFSTLC